MDNQHKQITGYRDLSQAEIELMNEIKRVEAQVAALYKAMQWPPGRISQRWAEIARTHFEQGFSALVRSVAKPASPFESREWDGFDEPGEPIR